MENRRCVHGVVTASIKKKSTGRRYSKNLSLNDLSSILSFSKKQIKLNDHNNRYPRIANAMSYISFASMVFLM